MATRTKRYEIEAERLDELLLRIETEMGPSARLTPPREFRRGAWLGFIGGRRFVEIEATLEIELDGGDQLDAAEATAQFSNQHETGLPDSAPADAVLQWGRPFVASEPVARPVQHGDEALQPPYHPPMQVRPSEQSMPLALDEV
jgi:hypothetical protein